MKQHTFGAPGFRYALGIATFALLAALVVALPAQATQPQLATSAVTQIHALDAIKDAKTVRQRKIDSRLYLGMLHERGDSRLSSLREFRFVKAETDGRVAVDIVLDSAANIKQMVDTLKRMGAITSPTVATVPRVTARVRLRDLDALSALAQVRAIRQHIPALTNKINTSEGDATHDGPGARVNYGTTGAGVKVCVMSDGVDSLASVQASGDLPAGIDVLPGQAGSGDEGTAMLEIVHDVAPGAALGFAQAADTEPGFAQNIISLGISGCNIIVDDIIYLDESPFEDGPVAQAVNLVTNAGVLYFSSAGNEGNLDDGTSGTWEGDFKTSSAVVPAPLAGMTLHDFGDGGNSIRVDQSSRNYPILIWAEHYDFATGNASTDYDMYVLNDGLSTVYDSATDTQDGAGGDDYPIEFIGGGTYTGDRLVIARKTVGTTSAPMFNLIVFRGRLDPALATNGATRGHSAAAAAFSVAATPAGPSFGGLTPAGPYPGLFTSANATESFSSDGPRRIILDGLTGTELTSGNRSTSGGQLRQKPDITAADGVSTAAPGFATFYGTSAAAPHAAAIAALLKSAVPSLTPAQVRTALTSSAIDIEAAGVDRNTGAGIVMPDAALTYVGATLDLIFADGFEP